jgi:hypothetical protein
MRRRRRRGRRSRRSPRSSPAGSKVLGVLERERVEAEDLAQDREIVFIRLVEVEPEEAPAREQLRDLLRLKCISALPRSWTTTQVLGALRWESGGCASSCSPTSVASRVAPRRVLSHHPIVLLTTRYAAGRNSSSDRWAGLRSPGPTVCQPHAWYGDALAQRR